MTILKKTVSITSDNQKSQHRITIPKCMVDIIGLNPKDEIICELNVENKEITLKRKQRTNNV